MVSSSHSPKKSSASATAVCSACRIARPLAIFRAREATARHLSSQYGFRFLRSGVPHPRQTLDRSSGSGGSPVIVLLLLVVQTGHGPCRELSPGLAPADSSFRGRHRPDPHSRSRRLEAEPALNEGRHNHTPDERFDRWIDSASAVVCNGFGVGRAHASPFCQLLSNRWVLSDVCGHDGSRLCLPRGNNTIMTMSHRGTC